MASQPEAGFITNGEVQVAMCRCGGVPVRFDTRGGGVGVKCLQCGTEYSHPAYSWEQMLRVWNHAMTKGPQDEE